MADSDNLHQTPAKSCSGRSLVRWLTRKIVYESTEFYDSLMIVVPLWLLMYFVFSGFPDLDRFVTGVLFGGNGVWFGERLFFIETVVGWGAWLVPAGVASIALACYAISFRQGENGRFYIWRNHLLYLAGTVAACFLAVAIFRYFSTDYGPFVLSVCGSTISGSGRYFPVGNVFCLFALYFVFRDTYPRLARLILSVVLFLGVACTVMEMAGGRQFLSGNLVTLVMDWSICAVLYRLSLGRILGPKPLLLPRHQPTLVAVTVVYWLVFFNRVLFGHILSQRGLATMDVLLQVASVFALLSLGFFAVLNLVVFPGVLKGILAILTLTAAIANYFSLHYGVVVNTDMINNVLATDLSEAGELLDFSMCVEVLFGALPLLFIIVKSPIVHEKLLGRLQWAAGLSIGAFLLGGTVLLVSFQGFASLVRGEPVVRHMITPLNVVSATVRATLSDARAGTARPRKVIDENPGLGPTWRQQRGALTVVVVGETARLANWGLGGYKRNTTPELSRRNVYAFRETVSCGTSTDVSLPCMFSRTGRVDYDRKRILEEESLLPVLQRAGLRVFWMDNQSGCKGVCDGVPELKINRNMAGKLCKNGRCLDGALLAGLDTHAILNPHGGTVLFLHQLGNHGPSYFRRYPRDFEVFRPACKDDKLQNCSKEEIVNAYDNAVLYTDYVLSGLIDWLAGMRDLDTALLYVSDHGESLGENNLFLHGAPWMIAPKEQTRVPMFLWLSDSYRERLGLDEACMRKTVAGEQASHDMLYSSLLGLLDVKSSTYNGKQDFTHACRNPGLALQVARTRALSGGHAKNRK